MRLVKIAQEIGIFFDRWDWENGSAYEAMDEMRTLIPRNRLKFDRDLLCWFTDNRMLDVVERLVKKYDQTGLEKIEWEWDKKELKSRKKNDLYVWLYKQISHNAKPIRVEIII